MKILVFGKGHVGRAIAKVAKEAGHSVELVSLRHGKITARGVEIAFIATREGAIEEAARALVPAMAKKGVAAHVSGRASLLALAPLSDAGIATARFHPIASFVARGAPRSLSGVHVLIEAERRTARRLATLAKEFGLVPWSKPGLAEQPAYHAALAITANGAAALAAVGADLLRGAGITEKLARTILGSLLATVAANVAAVGLPRALSGPVRRGDFEGARRILGATTANEERGLAAASMLMQVRMARALGEADRSGLDAIEREVLDILADPHLKKRHRGLSSPR